MVKTMSRGNYWQLKICSTRNRYTFAMYYTTCLHDLNFQRNSKQFTFPTYWGSDPMYSSRTKNWFHTQPLLTRWADDLLSGTGTTFSLGSASKICGCVCSGVRRPPSNRTQRSRDKQFLVSIGNDFPTASNKNSST